MACRSACPILRRRRKSRVSDHMYSAALNFLNEFALSVIGTDVRALQKQEEEEAKVLAQFEESFGVDNGAEPEAKPSKPAGATLSQMSGPQN